MPFFLRTVKLSEMPSDGLEGKHSVRVIDGFLCSLTVSVLICIRSHKDSEDQVRHSIGQVMCEEIKEDAAEVEMEHSQVKKGGIG